MDPSRNPSRHPGTILRERFLEPNGISQYRLARDIGVPPIRISQIVRGKRAITPDTALRLARYFDTTAEYWMEAQAGYELAVEEARVGDILREAIRPYGTVARGMQGRPRRENIRRRLEDREGELRERFGVQRLWLLGSVARDTAGPRSDVDVVVEFRAAPDFDRFMGLKLFLEDLVGRSVDLATRRSLRPELRSALEREGSRVA